MPVVTADVAIVGGGVMGAAMAHALAARGAGRVILLERRFLAAGSTGKSGAIVRQHYSTTIGAALARRSLDVFRAFDDYVGGDCGWTPTGMVLLVRGADRFALEANLERQRTLGIRSDLLDGSDLAALAPDLDLADDVLGCHEPDAGFADAVRTTRAYAAAASRGGARIEEGCSVLALRTEGGRCTGVVTDRLGTVAAGTVILAAGPWSATLAAAAGLDLPAHAARVQVALARPAEPRGMGATTPVVLDLTLGIYFKPWAGPVVQIGSLDPREGENHVDPDLCPLRADTTFIESAMATVARRSRALRRAIPFGGFSALYTVTPDWYPLVGFAPGVDGLLVVTGFSGHGFKLAPAISEIAAALVTGDVPPIDPRPLRPSRFLEGEPVRSAYTYSVIG